MNNIKNLFNMDKVRILKILEMFQYAIVFYVLTLTTTNILNKYIFKETEQEIKKMSKIKLLLNVLSHLFILVVILFYIRKIAKAIPSISSLIDSDFKPFTTFEYVIHIITVFLLSETLKSLHYKIERLRGI